MVSSPSINHKQSEGLKDKVNGKENANNNSDPKHKKSSDADEKLSEEDQKLVDDIDMIFERLSEPNQELYLPSIRHLTDLIRTSTSSMTAIPRPLKFLRPRFQDLEEIYKKWKSDSTDPQILEEMADILSVLGMTLPDEKRQRITLEYRLAGSSKDPGLWGHEYVRHLAMEIGEEYHARQDSQTDEEIDIDEIRYPELDSLARIIVPFFLTHNAEADAVDLLMEIDLLNDLPQYIDMNTHSRVCLYLLGFVKILPFPENDEALQVIYQIFLNQKKYFDAFTTAVQLDNNSLSQAAFDAAASDSNADPLVLKQIAIFAAGHHVPLKANSEPLNELLSNTHLSRFYKMLMKELQLTEPCDPKDVYKTHLDNSRQGIISSFDSSRQSLASCFVSGFSNVATGQDKLLLTEDQSKSWIYRTKLVGMVSATAAMGLLYLWDVESALANLDHYLFHSDTNIKAGALLAVSISNIGIRSDSDPVLAILSEHITENPNDNVLKRTAIFGLGLAYAGTNHSDSAAIFLNLLNDPSTPISVAALCALSLGLIKLGRADSEAATAIIQNMMIRSNEEFESKWSIFFVLGLSLLYLACEDTAEATIKTLEAIPKKVAHSSLVFVECCAYAGTGNVLKIQQMLHICSGSLDHKFSETDEDEEMQDSNSTNATTKEASSSENQNSSDTETPAKSDKLYHAFATIGVGLIAMGDSIGTEMAMRHLGHLMHYGGSNIRKAVPLAMGLLHVSNPDARTFDTLSRHSHDNDLDVALNAILSMGLLGAGTNNARLAQLFRQLANYYSRKPSALFIVRLTQGLLHAGRGTITINPYDTDGRILNKNALAGILITLTITLDSNNFFLSVEHWLLFSLSLAFRPRMLFTVDEELNPLPVPVRIGQALDTVGQAGKPKTITGWVTQSTPVLLPFGDRAELATEEYNPLASHLEGIVICKKDPEYMEM